MSEIKWAWCPYGEDDCEKIVLKAGWVLEWYEHVRLYHGLIDGTWICPLASCGKHFWDFERFRVHIPEHPCNLLLEQAEKVHGGPIPSNKDSDLHYCPYAFACAHSSFANEDDLTRHIRNIHEMFWGGWQCPMCQKQYQCVARGLKRHIKEGHSNDPRREPARDVFQVCWLCGLTGFSSRDSLRSHTVVSHVDVLDRRCWHPECTGKEYQSHAELVYHVNQEHRVVCCRDGCEKVAFDVHTVCSAHWDVAVRERVQGRMSIGSITNGAGHS